MKIKKSWLVILFLLTFNLFLINASIYSDSNVYGNFGKIVSSSSSCSCTYLSNSSFNQSYADNIYVPFSYTYGFYSWLFDKTGAGVDYHYAEVDNHISYDAYLNKNLGSSRLAGSFKFDDLAGTPTSVNECDFGSSVFAGNCTGKFIYNGTLSGVNNICLLDKTNNFQGKQNFTNVTSMVYLVNNNFTKYCLDTSCISFINSTGVYKNATSGIIWNSTSWTIQ